MLTGVMWRLYTHQRDRSIACGRIHSCGGHVCFNKHTMIDIDLTDTSMAPPATLVMGQR